MRAVIQRVTSASVVADGVLTGSIEHGLMILFGAADGDTERECDRLAEKISKLRIFEDSEGKTNLSINDVGGDALVVSQFTLLADCHKGNRPSFVKAGSPDKADSLYRYFSEALSKLISGKVENGVFGADMKVSLVNDGPFTIVLDCIEGNIL
ncbi:MAG: D-tyrosyl-tRNA(Tyr) deacylase [Ruminococcus sp.]|nr:D-tyrosyl-tRNA(Tyr) deacylase [Ruminococcus sp.]